MQPEGEDAPGTVPLERDLAVLAAVDQRLRRRQVEHGIGDDEVEDLDDHEDRRRADEDARQARVAGFLGHRTIVNSPKGVSKA